MAKDELKQARIDYERVQKANKLLVKENERLKGVGDDLVASREDTKDARSKTNILQGQYNELLTKTKGLEKAAEGYSDPKELKDKLKASEDLVSEKEKTNQELTRNLSLSNKKNQDLLSKDDLSAEAMQQVQEKDKKVKVLENELVSVKKKMAKYEGDFRFPSGGTVLLSVPMGDGKVAEAAIYSPKQPSGAPSVIVTAITQDGKAVSVDFKKA